MNSFKRVTNSQVIDTKRIKASQVLILLCSALFMSHGKAYSAEKAVVIPPPASDEPASNVRSEKMVISGGCFWGVQGVYQHVHGVLNAVSGYAGGRKETASYSQVSTGETGHAESVEITYDPKQITYGQLLQVFFSVAHNPTELNRQGPDTGTQYRSAVFPLNETQQRVAQSYVAQLNQAKAFGVPVVTNIETYKGFYPAESYHQNYLTLNPSQPYIVYNDLPKIEQLRQLFPKLYLAKPVLVGAVDH
jgi:peptide-methionine (S)-S-oxide reductase